MYDVFISYRRDGGFGMARLIYEHLKGAGLSPFLDLEELQSGLFNIELYNSIEESANFVLVLPPNSLDRCKDPNDWLRLEIEHAMLKNKNIVPVMMTGFTWPDDLPTTLSNLPSYNGVPFSPAYFDAGISKLITMLIGIDIHDATTKTFTRKATDRIQNKYFSNDDKHEVKRLKIQQKLLKEFDQDVYDQAVLNYQQLSILDIGSNDGSFIMDRIGRNEKVKNLIGLEYDRAVVEIANQKYAEQGKIAFFYTDVEADDFEENVEQIMQSQNIDSFNVINVSMVLLHLKSPFRLLKTLRQFLCKGGTIIIKDIDDGLNMAYPDEDGSFARIIDICNKNETSGCRQSGRQIYTYLKRAGYKDIRLVKQGLSTVGLDCDQRFAMFDTYFSFILDDLKIMRERYPQDKKIAQDLQWYSNNYEDIQGRFQDDNLYFLLGFMLFTAIK